MHRHDALHIGRDARGEHEVAGHRIGGDEREHLGGHGTIETEGIEHAGDERSGAGVEEDLEGDRGQEPIRRRIDGEAHEAVGGDHRGEQRDSGEDGLGHTRRPEHLDHGGHLR